MSASPRASVAPASTPLPSSDRSSLRFFVAFAVCALAYALPLWLVKYPPMVDLPQHAAQLSIWKHFGDPEWGAADYVLNWRTPYLISYLIARPFAAFLSPLEAMKVPITVAIVGLPVSLAYVLRSLDQPIDRWWSLLGFPIAFGYAFYWGFINFLLAVTVGLVFIGLGERWGRAPTQRRGAALAALGVALFYSHALAYLFCVGVAVVRQLARSSLRRQWRQLWPYALPAPIVFLWYASASGNAMAQQLDWKLGAHRVVWLTARILGNEGDLQAALVGLVLLVLPFLAFRPKRRLVDWLPFIGMMLVMLFAPHLVFGTAFVYERAAVFLVPFLLLALEPRAGAPSPKLIRTVVLTVCLAWGAVVASRMLAFDYEAREWDTIEAKMEPGRAVRSLTFRLFSPFVLGPPLFDHFSMYYQANKGGSNGSSFAGNFLSFARYRDGHPNPVSNRWEPQRFDWRREPAYDYYVVRAPLDLQKRLFAGAEASIRLEAHDGLWWLYRRIAPFPVE